MTIEEMIKAGCTYEDAADALDDLWEAAIKRKEKELAIKDAEQDVIAAYENYCKIVYPEISEKQLASIVGELEKTISMVSKILATPAVSNELQRKSNEKQEESKKAASGINKKSLKELFEELGW